MKTSGDLVLCLVEHNTALYWQIVALRNKVLRKPLNLEFSKSELLAEYDQIHFGFYKGDKLMGCFAFVKKSDSTLKMRQVAVDPVIQGQGIGQQMVKASENWAIKNGYNLIELSARSAAKSFYQKLNYIAEGAVFEEVGIPHYKMKKALIKSAHKERFLNIQVK
ncbi:MAG: GNAT family N-acetyltransferase [Bacteroidia bacterium]